MKDSHGCYCCGTFELSWIVQVCVAVPAASAAERFSKHEGGTRTLLGRAADSRVLLNDVGIFWMQVQFCLTCFEGFHSCTALSGLGFEVFRFLKLL